MICKFLIVFLILSLTLAEELNNTTSQLSNSTLSTEENPVKNITETEENVKTSGDTTVVVTDHGKTVVVHSTGHQLKVWDKSIVVGVTLLLASIIFNERH